MVKKNGIATLLGDGIQDSEANSVYVINNDVYVVGYQNNKATLWKNDIATYLGDGTKTSVANSIYIQK